MRRPRSTFAAARPFWTSNADSEIITLTPSAAQRRPCCDPGVSAEPLRVRLVRVRLRGGATEGLVTSLRDGPRYPTRLFAARYPQRWSTEEHDKRAQRWAELESFSGLSPLVIEFGFQDSPDVLLRTQRWPKSS